MKAKSHMFHFFWILLGLLPANIRVYKKLVMIFCLFNVFLGLSKQTNAEFRGNLAKTWVLDPKRIRFADIFQFLVLSKPVHEDKTFHFWARPLR